MSTGKSAQNTEEGRAAVVRDSKRPICCIVLTKKMHQSKAPSHQAANQRSVCGLKRRSSGMSALWLFEKSRSKRYKACSDVGLMVGIEPTTFSLRVRCSAIEPHQRIWLDSPANLDSLLIIPARTGAVKAFPGFFFGKEGRSCWSGGRDRAL